MEPTMNYPFNVRSFFTNRETKDIGSGLELWRGYFQSVRPGIGKMLINVDISTGTMYKAGSLLKLCMDFIGRDDPNALSPRRGFPDRQRILLQRFISGIRVLTTSHGSNGPVQTPRVIKKLSNAGADSLTFSMREGGSMTVAQYYQRIQNKSLKYPDVICVEVRTLLWYLRSFSERVGRLWRFDPLGIMRRTPRTDHAKAGASRENQGCP